MSVSRYQLITAAILLSQAVAQAYGSSDEAPSEEFLEYLGEFQTQDGEWFDPLNLLEVKQNEIQQNETRQTEIKSDNEGQSDE